MIAKHKKISFIISIILFVLFFPLTIIGMISHFSNANPNHEFHYKDKLYFYDKSSNLIGTYDCNYENCGYAKETIEDEEYGIDYFKLGLEPTALIDDKYAIIGDYAVNQDEVIIYDIVNKSKIGTYPEYKIYNVGLTDNNVIVKNKEGKYGVIKLNESILPVLPFEYDFIGIPKIVDSSKNKIIANSFIVKKDDHYSIVGSDGTMLSSQLNIPITSFNTSTMVLKNENGTYGLYNYDGTVNLPGEYKYIGYISEYIEVKDNNGNYFILSSDGINRVSQVYQITDESNISSKINGTNLEIIIDGEMKETIEIS